MTTYGTRTATGLAVIAVIGLAQCDRPAKPVSEGPPPVRPAEVAAPEPVNVVLGRADILAAVAAAASDAAGGIVRTGPSGLDGRQFRLTIAFGCGGEDPAPPGIEQPRDGAARWVRQAREGALRLSLSPADWSGANPVGSSPPGFDAIEGVWVNEPWMSSEDCPVPGLPMMDERSGPPQPRVGLAMLRAEGSSRIGGSGSRDLSYLVRADGDGAPPAPAQGYRLEIEGRLKSWVDGRVIRCRQVWPDQAPPCVVGAEVDRIAFKDAAGARLSEWRSS